MVKVAPAGLSLLSVTVAVIVELPRLVTLVGSASRSILAGRPALIVMVAVSEAPAPVVAVRVTSPAVPPEV